jgi:hypothetical protein
MLVYRAARKAFIRPRDNTISLCARPVDVIDLPEDFRDLFIELHDAGADFVLVRADDQNAKCVYRALAAFGAPLESFEVGEEGFAQYDGVLQIGLPPRRIDISQSNHRHHVCRRIG